MRAAPQCLILPAQVRVAILNHVRQSPHIETCGLLVGQGGETVIADEVVPTLNNAVDQAKRFEIDPQAQFDLLRRLRGSGQRIIGHYHSHPGGQPVPSTYDLEMAADPEALWLIVGSTPPEIAAFYCPDQARGFVALPITDKP